MDHVGIYFGDPDRKLKDQSEGDDGSIWRVRSLKLACPNKFTNNFLEDLWPEKGF